MLQKILSVLVLSLFPVYLTAQVDSIPEATEENLNQQLEDFYINTEETSDFDFIGLLDYLEYFLKKPLSLNSVTRNQLESLGLLNPIQINNFLLYREKLGPLLEIYELQAIPGFDLPTIRNILPYVTVSPDNRLSFRAKLKNWKRPRIEYLFRFSRIIENSKGILEEKYLGDPNQYFSRLRIKVADAIQIGFTGEKDRGEEFFSGSNPAGFDFYSAHLSIRKPFNGLEEFILGDYNFAMGQGLIFFGGFAPGKGADISASRRRGRTLRPYTSANEIDFLRGTAIECQLGDSWSIAAFASHKNIDGNLLETDTLDPVEDNELFSSLLLSGFHRTENEIADEKQIRQTTLGGTIEKRFNGLQLSGNVVFDRFSSTFAPRSEPYNRYRFTGSSLWNASLDYSWQVSNFNFYGETAVDPSGNVAILQGLLTGLGKYTYLSLLYRNFPKEFQTLRGRPFSETRITSNEEGFYTGLEFRPSKNFHFTGYLDFWRHPWLRFNVDAPSKGREWLLRWKYKVRKGIETYAQLRQEVKEKNASANETAFDFLVPIKRTYFRLHLDYPFSKALRWRSRAEWSWYDSGTGGPIQKGFLLYQDLILKPMNSPWSATTRLAFYNTDGYNARIYAYENDVAYAFSIPSYFDRGTRFYLNIRYKLRNGLTLEGRYAQTYKTSPGIGSGNDFIDGNKRTDVRLQMRWNIN